jgi:hypothetical protein
MLIERKWAMPNSKTFEIKPIKELIEETILPGEIWIDPFANDSKIATITNDLNPKFDTDYHMDALDFLKMFDDNSIDGVLYDAPYSSRQVVECYKGVGKEITKETTQSIFWSKHKDEIARIIKLNGKTVSCGWNSQGVGKNRGFELKRTLLVPHGGSHNDTIVTVEQKVS